MSLNEDISLRESLPSDVGEQEAHNTLQDASNLDQADSRIWESKTKRACVLVGSAILQLPIWGRLKFYYNLVAIHTHIRRLRHELRRLPRILFQQLDAAGES